MLEEYLIAHCSPTLASLKSASLFSCKCTSEDYLCGIIKAWNEKLKSRGVEIRLLHRSERQALIYVYRKSALANALNNPEVRDYLSSCGYDACYCCEGCDALSCSIENCLRHLKCRISEGRENGSTHFPHEMDFSLTTLLQISSVLSKTKAEILNVSALGKSTEISPRQRRHLQDLKNVVMYITDCGKAADAVCSSSPSPVKQTTISSKRKEISNE